MKTTKLILILILLGVLTSCSNNISFEEKRLIYLEGVLDGISLIKCDEFGTDCEHFVVNDCHTLNYRSFMLEKDVICYNEESIFRYTGESAIILKVN